MSHKGRTKDPAIGLLVQRSNLAMERAKQGHPISKVGALLATNPHAKTSQDLADPSAQSSNATDENLYSDHMLSNDAIFSSPQKSVVWREEQSIFHRTPNHNGLYATGTAFLSPNPSNKLTSPSFSDVLLARRKATREEAKKIKQDKTPSKVMSPTFLALSQGSLQIDENNSTLYDEFQSLHSANMVPAFYSEIQNTVDGSRFDKSGAESDTKSRRISFSSIASHLSPNMKPSIYSSISSSTSTAQMDGKSQELGLFNQSSLVTPALQESQMETSSTTGKVSDANVMKGIKDGEIVVEVREDQIIFSHLQSDDAQIQAQSTEAGAPVESSVSASQERDRDVDEKIIGTIDHSIVFSPQPTNMGQLHQGLMTVVATDSAMQSSTHSRGENSPNRHSISPRMKNRKPITEQLPPILSLSQESVYDELSSETFPKKNPTLKPSPLAHAFSPFAKVPKSPRSASPSRDAKRHIAEKGTESTQKNTYMRLSTPLGSTSEMQSPFVQKKRSMVAASQSFMTSQPNDNTAFAASESVDNDNSQALIPKADSKVIRCSKTGRILKKPHIYKGESLILTPVMAAQRQKRRLQKTIDESTMDGLPRGPELLFHPSSSETIHYGAVVALESLDGWFLTIHPLTGVVSVREPEDKWYERGAMPFNGIMPQDIISNASATALNSNKNNPLLAAMRNRNVQVNPLYLFQIVDLRNPHSHATINCGDPIWLVAIDGRGEAGWRSGAVLGVQLDSLPPINAVFRDPNGPTPSSKGAHKSGSNASKNVTFREATNPKPQSNRPGSSESRFDEFYSPGSRLSPAGESGEMLDPLYYDNSEHVSLQRLLDSSTMQDPDIDTETKRRKEKALKAKLASTSIRSAGRFVDLVSKEDLEAKTTHRPSRMQQDWTKTATGTLGAGGTQRNAQTLQASTSAPGALTRSTRRKSTSSVTSDVRDVTPAPSMDGSATVSTLNKDSSAATTLQSNFGVVAQEESAISPSKAITDHYVTIIKEGTSADRRERLKQEQQKLRNTVMNSLDNTAAGAVSLLQGMAQSNLHAGRLYHSRSNTIIETSGMGITSYFDPALNNVPLGAFPDRYGIITPVPAYVPEFGSPEDYLIMMSNKLGTRGTIIYPSNPQYVDLYCSINKTAIMTGKWNIMDARRDAYQERATEYGPQKPAKSRTRSRRPVGKNGKERDLDRPRPPLRNNSIVYFEQGSLFITSTTANNSAPGIYPATSARLQSKTATAPDRDIQADPVNKLTLHSGRTSLSKGSTLALMDSTTKDGFEESKEKLSDTLESSHGDLEKKAAEKKNPLEHLFTFDNSRPADALPVALDSAIYIKQEEDGLVGGNRREVFLQAHPDADDTEGKNVLKQAEALASAGTYKVDRRGVFRIRLITSSSPFDSAPMRGKSKSGPAGPASAEDANADTGGSLLSRAPNQAQTVVELANKSSSMGSARALLTGERITSKAVAQLSIIERTRLGLAATRPPVLNSKGQPMPVVRTEAGDETAAANLAINARIARKKAEDKYDSEYLLFEAKKELAPALRYGRQAQEAVSLLSEDAEEICNEVAISVRLTTGQSIQEIVQEADDPTLSHTAHGTPRVRIHPIRENNLFHEFHLFAKTPKKPQTADPAVLAAAFQLEKENNAKAEGTIRPVHPEAIFTIEKKREDVENEVEEEEELNEIEGKPKVPRQVVIPESFQRKCTLCTTSHDTIHKNARLCSEHAGLNAFESISDASSLLRSDHASIQAPFTPNRSAFPPNASVSNLVGAGSLQSSSVVSQNTPFDGILIDLANKRPVTTIDLCTATVQVRRHTRPIAAKEMRKRRESIIALSMQQAGADDSSAHGRRGSVASMLSSTSKRRSSVPNIGSPMPSPFSRSSFHSPSAPTGPMRAKKRSTSSPQWSTRSAFQSGPQSSFRSSNQFSAHPGGSPKAFQATSRPPSPGHGSLVESASLSFSDLQDMYGSVASQPSTAPSPPTIFDEEETPETPEMQTHIPADHVPTESGRILGFSIRKMPDGSYAPAKLPGLLTPPAAPKPKVLRWGVYDQNSLDEAENAMSHIPKSHLTFLRPKTMKNMCVLEDKIRDAQTLENFTAPLLDGAGLRDLDSMGDRITTYGSEFVHLSSPIAPSGEVSPVTESPIRSPRTLSPWSAQDSSSPGSREAGRSSSTVSKPATVNLIPYYRSENSYKKMLEDQDTYIKDALFRGPYQHM